MVVTFLGSLVQSCCGEGGTLQANTGVYGECLQCFSRTGCAPSSPHHGVLCFHGLHFSGSRLLCQELSEDILGCMHFPGLSCSGSGSRVLHKGADLVGPGFCALPRSEQVTRCLVSAVTPRCVWGRMHLITSPIPAAWFSACTMGVPSQVCRVSLLGS